MLLINISKDDYESVITALLNSLTAMDTKMYCLEMENGRLRKELEALQPQESEVAENG